MIIKEGFRANSTLIRAITMDGYSIIIHNKHIVKLKITNLFNEYRVSNVNFIATSIKRYNVILS
jgi:hypothetical protein